MEQDALLRAYPIDWVFDVLLHFRSTYRPRLA
jgi:hypothetical protein